MPEPSEDELYGAGWQPQGVLRWTGEDRPGLRRQPVGGPPTCPQHGRACQHPCDWLDGAISVADDRAGERGREGAW